MALGAAGIWLSALIPHSANAETGVKTVGFERPVVIEAPTLPVTKSGYIEQSPVMPSMTYFPVLPLNAEPDLPPQLLPLASSQSIDADHGSVTRAVIVIHDVSRDNYAPLAQLSSLAGIKAGTTLILAPQFLLQSDIAALAARLPNGGRDLVRWPLDGWIDGGDSINSSPVRSISSFTAIDLLILYLSDKQLFPNLKDIVIVGHGAGADFVLRYAATGQAPDLLVGTNTGVRFVAANPSSFMYFTPMRPLSNKPGFILPDKSKCPNYDDYRYGINNLNNYGKRAGANAIKLRYPTRNVTYIAGEKVATDDHYPDTGCAALIEGPDRLMRMMNYNLYLGTIYGDDAAKTQKFATVPQVGYDAPGIYGSACGMSSIFGDGDCTPPPLTGARTP